MSDPALRRTVRRGFALVLVQLAVVSAQLYDAFGGGDDTITTFTSLPIAVGAVVYLLGSLGRSLAGAVVVDPGEGGGSPDGDTGD